MKKQLQLSLLVLAASTTCLANAGNYKGENYKGEAMPAPCVVPLTLKDGFYLGLQLGADQYRVRQSSGFSNPEPDAVSFDPANSATGWVGGLLGGYGMYFSNNFYLGGELFWNTSNAGNNSYSVTSGSGAEVTENFNTKISVNTSYGIGLLPGYKINDSTLLYIRLGWNRVNLKASESGNTETVVYSTSTSNWSNGFNFGVGMESAVYENWSVRGEFTHTNLGSFSSAFTGSTFKPLDNQFMAAVIYHFA